MSYLGEEEIAEWRRQNGRWAMLENALNSGVSLVMGVLLTLVMLVALAIGVIVAFT